MARRPLDARTRTGLWFGVLLGPPFFALLALRPDFPCLPGYDSKPTDSGRTIFDNFAFAMEHSGLYLPLIAAYLALFAAALAAPRLAPAESETTRLLILVAPVCILAALVIPTFTAAPTDCAAGPVGWTIFSQVFLATTAATALAWFAGQRRDDG